MVYIFDLVSLLQATLRGFLKSSMSLEAVLRRAAFFWPNAFLQPATAGLSISVFFWYWSMARVSTWLLLQ